jgi:hypothetical protein
MKTTRPGKIAFPILYQNFSSAEEIGRTINRSRSYVFKAMKVGFTDREWELLNERIASNRNS